MIVAAARRLAWMATVAWLAISVAFALNELLPGDPARMVAGLQARPADVVRIREQLGLDRPPLVRYVRFWERLVHLGPRPIHPADSSHATCALVVPLGTRAVHVDLGKSFQMGQPVVDIVAARFPRTFALAVASVLIELLVGLSIGTVAWTAVSSARA